MPIDPPITFRPTPLGIDPEPLGTDRFELLLARATAADTGRAHPRGLPPRRFRRTGEQLPQPAPVRAR